MWRTSVNARTRKETPASTSRATAPRTPRYPKPTADVIKSWLVWEKRSISDMSAKLDAARILWETLLARGTTEPFDFTSLTAEDLYQAETRMRGTWASSTTYKVAQQLARFADFLASHRVCRRLHYAVQTPRPEDVDRRTLDGMSRRAALLPTPAALNGLADLYTRATTPADLLLSAAIAVLAVTGLRIGELLCLPEDCEVHEIEPAPGGGKRARYGLRYYSEKQKDNVRRFDIFWCTDLQAELLRPAIARIRMFTAPARARARVLEENPDRVPIPETSWAGRMSPKQVADALGLASQNSVFKIPENQLPRQKEEREIFYRVLDVEQYLLSRRVDKLWTVDRRDGTFQMLSESLFVVPLLFFHSAKGTNPLLIEPVNEQQVSDFLAGRKSSNGSSTSAFERFDIREADGSFCSINPHQLRHFVNDLADRGGMAADSLTRWMNRSNPKDTEAYRHMTPRERARWARGAIKTGELVGPVVDAFWELPEEAREDFLDAHLPHVHMAGVALCVHDWSVLPCPYHLNCLRNCKHHLRQKGNAAEQQALVQIGVSTRRALTAAENAELTNTGDEEHQVAAAWKLAHQETLAGVEAALEIDERKDVPDGAFVQVFPEGNNLHVPLTS